MYCDEAGDSMDKLRKENEELKKENEFLKQTLNEFRKEFESFKYKMSWRKFKGNAFDINKEYRVRFTESSGPNSVECHSSKELFFCVSTANHFYGCITIDNQKQWHYRLKGNSAQKPQGHDNNGSVYCIEERG